MAFFLSVVASFNVGSSIIVTVEESFWSFLEDFQEESADGYDSVLNNKDLSDEFEAFLIYFSWDIAALCAAMFWHSAFLLVMGVLGAQVILDKINTYVNTTYTATTTPIKYGWKLLLFGLLYGATDYLAGEAVSVNSDTILKMLSFIPQTLVVTNTTQTSAVSGTTGTTTTTTSVIKTSERKKDMFGL